MGPVAHPRVEVRFVGSYEVLDAVPAPEGGDWRLGRGPEGDALVRLPTGDDRLTVDNQREVLRGISDPRVPAVLAHDPQTGAIALTYAVGAPLTEAIAQRTEEGGDGVVLTPATLVDVLLEVGRALQSAHAAGVVHGGLDPDRVRLGSDGRLWIFGFGAGHPPSTPWLPPELARGEPATPATDQWSLAAIGTGLVLGHAIWPWYDRAAVSTPGGPVAAGDAAELIQTIHHQWPALARTLGRALSPHPADRYPSLSGLLADLTELGRLAGGTSERPALGHQLSSRRARGEPTGAKTLVLDRTPTPVPFHRADTVHLPTTPSAPPPRADRPLALQEQSIVPVAQGLAALLVVLIVGALLSRAF